MRTAYLVPAILVILSFQPIRVLGAKQAARSGPKTFLLDRAALSNIRRRVEAGESGPWLEALRNSAEESLRAGPFSVMQKTVTPPSGDKHDFMSLGPYWWPNPRTANGLPYIRRDGQVNPASLAISDREEVGELESAVNALALAYYLLGHERFAVHATQLLETWFLDPATRMNPNMKFAQAIPGVTEGRGTGLIGTRGFAKIADDVDLLAGSPAWTAADQRGMTDWFSRYLSWLMNSTQGDREARAKNNHGTWFAVQAVSISLFLGKAGFARSLLRKAMAERLPSQIGPDGSQPLELARTKSLAYSAFNLSAWFELAALGHIAGVDVWNYRTKDGKSLRKALDFLVPYATGQRRWPYQQIHRYDPAGFARLLLVASAEYREPRYKQLALKLDPSLKSSIEVLLPFAQ